MDKQTQDQIRSARNLIKAGAICSGISLIIGGVLLGMVGLICIFVGRSRYKKVSVAVQGIASLDLQMRKLIRVAFFVSIAALILNAVGAFVMLPLYIQAVESGDISLLYGGSGFGSSIAAGGSSTWG